MENLELEYFTSTLDIFLEEDKLNEIIQNCSDVKKIKFLLQIKSVLIKEGKQAKISFRFDRIMLLKPFDLEIIKNALEIQSDHTEFLNFIVYLQQNIKSDETNKKDRLFLLETFGMTLNFFKNSTLNSNDDYIINQAILDTYNFLLEKDKHDSNYDLFNFTFNILINNSLITSEILNNLWKYIIKTDNLELFCTLPTFLGTEVEKVFLSTITENKSFMVFIKKFMCCKNEYYRKQMNFFLRKFCENVFQKDEFTSQYLSFNKNNKEEVMKTWEYFFSLLEMSKEKQLHLLQPTLPMLNKIIKLHFFWSSYIYNIFLSHSHNVISYKTLFVLLKIDFNTKLELFQNIIGSIFVAYNKTEYSTWSVKAFNLLKTFLIRISNSKLLECFFEDFSKINWSPIPFFFMCETLLNSKQILIEIQSIMKLMDFANKIPNKFIRRGCRFLIKKHLETFLLQNNYLDNIEFIDVLQMFKYSKDYLTSDELKKSLFVKFRKNLEDFLTNCEYENICSIEIDCVLCLTTSASNEWYQKFIYIPSLNKKLSFSIFVRTKLDDPAGYYRKFVLENRVNGEDVKILSNKCYQFVIHEELYIKSCQILLDEVNFRNDSILLALKIVDQYEKNDSDQLQLIFTKWFKMLNERSKIDTNFYETFVDVFMNKSILLHNNNSETFLNQLLDLCTKISEFLPDEFLWYFFWRLQLFRDDERIDKQKITNFNCAYIKNILERKNPRYLEEVLVIYDYNFVDFEQFLKDFMNCSKRVVEIPLAISKIIQKYGNVDVITPLKNILVELLLYGEVPRKDQVAEFKLYYHYQFMQLDSNVSKSNKNEGINFLFQTAQVRIQAVNVLLKFKKFKYFADELSSLLLEKYMKDFNKRYFKDSQMHLNKLRILQSLLTLYPHIRKEKQNVIDFLFRSLSMEAHQVSVRFFIQWLLIELLLSGDDDNCVEKICDRINKVEDMQPSAIRHFIFILYHLGCRINSVNVWDKIMETVLPFTMGSEFKIRYYSQIAFEKCYDKAVNPDCNYLKDRYFCSYKAVKTVLSKTATKFDPIEKFLLESFSTDKHYTLENIFVKIPQITGVTDTEYLAISIDDYRTYSEDLLMFKRNDYPINVDLATNEIGENLDSEDECDCTKSSFIIQQKIIPNNVYNSQQKISELILIGSLVEKSPNLGGLCRTCEIFGVKSLVVKSSGIKRNHEFLSLSMSSENWVDLVEVKVENLKAYLESLKRKGICVIGAEQTSKSIKLTDYTFPKKCALLLGNEKQGIPADLLYLLDGCVEIPQMGVTRSLNVHVAASILIWEYTKQNNL